MDEPAYTNLMLYDTNYTSSAETDYNSTATPADNISSSAWPPPQYAADADDPQASTFWLSMADFISDNSSITQPLIIVGGCLGNVLAVLVFRLTMLRKQSSSYYLAALCISDTCFLVLTGLEYLTSYEYVNIWYRPVACELLTYGSGVASFLSVWFVVAFTAERYVAVLHPLRRPDWCTVTRAKLVLAICTLVSMVLNAPLLYFSDTVWNETRYMCELKPQKKVERAPMKCKHKLIVNMCLNQDLYRAYNLMDMVCVFLLPMLLIIVLNAFIAVTVWSGAGFHRRMTTHQQ